jgi:hypothetical protein
MDQMDYNAPHDCYQGDQSEFFFNARSTQYLTYIDRLFQYAADMGGVPGYVNMRFMQQSDAFIAMEQFPITVGVEIVVIRPSANGLVLLGMANRLALAMGGIPHWGKSVFGVLRSDLILANIPSRSLECYHFAVALIEEGQSQTFSSQFTRGNGLEPVSGVSVQELDRRTARSAFTVKQLLAAAQSRLAMPTMPKSILEVAREFAPSLRMNANGVDLPRGKASIDSPRVRVRDLSRRIIGLTIPVDIVPPPASGDPMGYLDANGTARVVFRGVDNHIYEMGLTDAWHPFDMAGVTGVDAAGDPMGYVDANGTARVIYRGVDSHIWEMALTANGWEPFDMMGVTGVDAAGDPMGYVGGGAAARVVYRGVDNHIHEIWTTDTWHHFDMTPGT